MGMGKMDGYGYIEYPCLVFDGLCVRFDMVWIQLSSLN